MFQSAMKDEKQPARKSSFWGIRCESGKKYSQIVNQKYHISMAALDPTSVKNGKEVVSLVVERDGSEFLLCNLQKDSVLQVNLNLFFDKGEKVVFSLKGQGIVHLTGYLIKDDNDQSDCTLQPKTLNDSIMLARDKVKSSGDANKSVQSKKNLSTQNDSWKVESKEIVTPKKKLFASPPKKSNEKFQTNITGVLEGDNWKVESEEDKNSASTMQNHASTSKKSTNVSPSKKTPQKKLFGSAKKESEDSSDDDDDEDDDDDDDDEEEETSDDDDNVKQLLLLARKRPISSVGEDDDDDEDEDDEDFDINDYLEEDSSGESDEDDDDEPPVKKKPNKDLPSNKKLKTETSTPLTGKKSTVKNVTEVIDIEDDAKNGDMNSSIGRTPMPKKRPESVRQKSALNDSKKATPSKDEDSSDDDSDAEMETSTGKVKETDKNKSAAQLNASSEVNTEKKKKKKKKKKGKADDSTAANESSASVNNDSLSKGKVDLSKTKYSRRLHGGVEYEDIRPGNGPIAKKGKLVYVYYTGRLANNEIFDSCQPGKSKPFVFKLGAGQVIQGWEVALEGMKVGGKRKIKIPPQMGYKDQRAGPIPPNSTLYFVVELKAVS
ncbi:46 kDa FK506-binding nuclear protein-like isoform X2 [Argiope bruennichi]|uniref:46 kDa FK506-binding nuclear protein-like isoform X2 n=1 Tax=Argiope bruennichi TaxID=94029 RepID=UPI002493E0D0|nr:46 kDa FK506-binding nuclear protein-like isoform X2 [Argiope bruennichi]